MKNLTKLCMACLFVVACHVEEFQTDLSTTDTLGIPDPDNLDVDTPLGVLPTPIREELGKSPTPNHTWKLIWSDEFNGNQLNPNKWVKTNSPRSRNPRRDKGIERWFFKPKNTFLNGNGQLILRGEKVSNNTMHCGSAETRNIFVPKYGYYEARIKVANTRKANHTAFWLQGANMGNVDGTGNDGAEIDIFESAWVGNYTKSVVHIDGYGADHQANTKRYETPGIHNGFHTYGMHWTQDFLRIYYDNQLKATYTGRWVPRVNEWIWLSVGASFGDGDFRSQPIGRLSDAEVDYVRVWQEVEGNNPEQHAFRLVNKATGRWMRTSGGSDDSKISMADPNHLGNWTTWKIDKTTGNYFYFVNEGTGKYIRPEANRIGAELVLKSKDYGGSWTQWETVNGGEGWFYLRNKETGKFLTISSTERNANLELDERDASDLQKWKFEFLKLN